MSAGNGRRPVEQVLLEQTIQHLATQLEAFRPQIAAGQRILSETAGYRIIIEPRLVLHAGQLVVPGRS